MTSEALQNPYFVRLYCKNIDKTHSLAEPNDKIQYSWELFLQKRGGGTTFEKATPQLTKVQVKHRHIKGGFSPRFYNFLHDFTIFSTIL